jgi:hypothetical protein
MGGGVSKAKNGPIGHSGSPSTGVSHYVGSDAGEVQEEFRRGVPIRMGNGVTPVLAIPGHHIVASDILAKGIVTIDEDKGRIVNLWNFGTTSAIESASVASALSGFRFAWGSWRASGA